MQDPDYTISFINLLALKKRAEHLLLGKVLQTESLLLEVLASREGSCWLGT